MKAINGTHASLSFVCNTIPVERSLSRCDREHSSPAAVGSLSAKAETTDADLLGSAVLGRFVWGLAQLARPAALRSGRHRRSLAADAPKYLIRDRDRIYGSEVRLRIASLGIEEILTAPRSPWQNPYVERVIGSIRRDCLNHFVILNARHLKRVLAWYFGYYHGSRTHLGLDKPGAKPEVGDPPAVMANIASTHAAHQPPRYSP